MNKSTDILNLTSRERGQKTAEYGALLALVTLGVVAALTIFALAVNRLLGQVI